MNETSTQEKSWRLDQDAFNKLLARLHPDREQAGEEYESLRQKLTSFFQRRGSLAAEELADKSLDRLMRKIAAGEQITSVPHYCLGVARLIWLEELKKGGRHYVPLDELELPVWPAVDEEEEELRYRCLVKCLQRLPAAERQLFVEYWCNEDQPNWKARSELAQQRGLTLRALRIRISRTKAKLEEALARCLKHGL